jgi:predicted dehydrogenase
LSLEEGQAAVKACEEAGVRLMVGHTLRFSPQYTRARELLQHETVGTPTVAHTYRGGLSPRGLNDWYLEPAKTGGVFVDLAVHDIDWLIWCLGPVTRVTARSTLHTSGPENEHGVATLRFETGAMAQVTANWRDAGRFHTCFELAGDRGVMRYDSAETTALELTLPDGSPTAPRPPGARTENSPYRNQLQHFFQQLETGGQFRITPGEALAALAVSLAAAESARTRVPTVPKLAEGGEAAW